MIRNITGRMTMRNRRVKEKYCLLFILTSFFIVCVGMVFFLPDLRARTSTGVQDVYEKLPDLFLAPPPPPPLENSIDNGSENNVAPRPLNPPPRRVQDRERLYAKIQEDLEKEQRRVIEKPRIIGRPEVSSSANPNRLAQMGSPNKNAESSDVSQRVVGLPSPDGNSPLVNPADSVLAQPRTNSSIGGGKIIYGGKDSDPEVDKKRDFIKHMMKDAWDNYVKYAWGHNELRPISQRGHSASIFGPAKIGATIVDALDTLYIMGLHDEYKQARDWVEHNLDFETIKAELSVFETNIRFVGGFLTAYALTGDTMFKDKAYSLGKKLLPAFDTPTGIPYALISLQSGSSKNYGWAASGSSILSEFGSLHLEFVYLSDVTGDPIFREKVYKIRDVIKQIDKPKGLYFNYVHPRMAKFTQSHVSMGALGDSFYEYLLKSYIQTGDNDARQMYDDAIDAFEKNGLIRYSKSGLLYFAEMRYDRLESKMDHLACFAGGMLALGAHTDPLVINHGSDATRANRHMKIAEGVTNTCHESYIRTATRLGPESFRFSDALEARALRQNEKYYILRPEVIESYFVMWRLTGDPKYRDWAWDAAQAIEKHCKAGEGGGYSGLRNVYSKDPQQDDVQQSFYLAETLKYLYLMFSSKELIDLDYWVFNTEAHPLPIRGKNPFYRAPTH
ncbi:Mannosyl-oligosaccharide alpha-1,2-mannosidase isoform A [Orchesella cincta]|uniref:alpha-1,2-Mannosidase n=1 Tax=Orchesella cincta TaxID=48709 RepID=A0A1D2MKY8_ORCCI|nr:Mannosyl-oligosaccharide alpha-1,2-mannosidase isoform A [Orchesella cincta]